MCLGGIFDRLRWRLWRRRESCNGFFGGGMRRVTVGRGELRCFRGCGEMFVRIS